MLGYHYLKQILKLFSWIIRLTNRFGTTLNLNWILEFNCLLPHPNFFFFCCSFFVSFHGYTFYIIYSQKNQNYIFSTYSYNCYTSLAFLNKFLTFNILLLLQKAAPNLMYLTCLLALHQASQESTFLVNCSKINVFVC